MSIASGASAFHNVDINSDYERLAKAIVVGGVQQFDYAFLASELCEDLCLMVDWDRDEIVRKLRVVEKRDGKQKAVGAEEGPYWWKLRRTCGDCEKPISDWNRKGYCDLCAKRHKTYDAYSKRLACPVCSGKMSDHATLCRTCENERRVRT